VEKIEAVWTHLPPPKGVDVKPIVTKVDENEGTVTAVITWRANDEENRSNPSSGFNPAHMVGWDVVQTSLLDDLLTMLNESAGLS
jgi:hypothetical protein